NGRTPDGAWQSRNDFRHGPHGGARDRVQALPLRPFQHQAVLRRHACENRFQIDVKWTDVQPNGAVTPVAEADVDRAESVLGVRFPDGYRTFVTRFGRGVLSGLVRFYTPAEVADLDGPRGAREWRSRIDQYWFWEESSGEMPKTRALQCVRI